MALIVTAPIIGQDAPVKTRHISLLNNLGTDELMTFRSTWNHSNLSAKKKLELLKAFFRHCLSAKLVASDPAAPITPPKVEDIQVMPFTE